jgi:hypothetical protein
MVVKLPRAKRARKQTAVVFVGLEFDGERALQGRFDEVQALCGVRPKVKSRNKAENRNIRRSPSEEPTAGRKGLRPESYILPKRFEFLLTEHLGENIALIFQRSRSVV